VTDSAHPVSRVHWGTKKEPLSAQAWREGKLFVGLLIERMVDAAASFFPWGYPLATTSQPMAGN